MSQSNDSLSLWRPSASLQALKQAALVRSVVHQWMAEYNILEVFTPALSVAGTTDPQIESLVVRGDGKNHALRYLHTSPEFAMKRILCAYPEQDIYQLATVFRAEESGRFHNSQFTLLEWYRVGMDHIALMNDVQQLLCAVWNAFEIEFPQIDRKSYVQEVFDRLGQWPDQLTGSQIRHYFLENERSFPQGLESDLSACLDLFMDEFVLPEFGRHRITFLTEYPCSQAALARIGTATHSDCPVAERFEVYIGKVELANGFHELADASVQRQRFEQEQRARQLRHQSAIPIDENLLSALQSGLPDCAGVALGVDRLLMLLGGYQCVEQVMSFSDDNA